MPRVSSITQNHTECFYNETVMFFYRLVERDLMFEEKHYNSTGVIITVFMTGIAIIFLNGLVLTAIFINRHLHFPFYYLLGNLALTDLCVGISYLFVSLQSGMWNAKLSPNQWFLQQGLINTSLMASMLNIMGIALERHKTIFTMQLHSNITNRHIFLLILGIWLVSILTSLLPSLGWNCMCELESCSEILPLFKRSYTLTLSLLSLLIISTMVLLYTCIFVYVWRSSRRMKEHTSQDRHRQTVVSLMCTVLVILGCFICCWTPALLLLMLDGLNRCPRKLFIVETSILTMVATNSTLNPIIYTFRDQNMRKTFRQIVSRVCPAHQ